MYLSEVQTAIDDFNSTQIVSEHMRGLITRVCAQYMSDNSARVPTPEMYAQITNTLKPEYRDIFAHIYSSCERINDRSVHAFFLMELNRVISRIISPYIVLCCSDTYICFKYLDVVLRHARRANKYLFVMTPDELGKTPAEYLADLRAVANAPMARSDVPALHKLLFAIHGTDINATFAQMFDDFARAHAEITSEYSRRDDVSERHREFGEILQQTQTMLDERTLTAAHALSVMRDPCVSELIGLESDVRRVWASLEEFFTLLDRVDTFPLMDIVYVQDIVHCGNTICTGLYKMQDTLRAPGVKFHALAYGITDVALQVLNDAVIQIQPSDQVCICTRRVLHNSLVMYLNRPDEANPLEAPYTFSERLRVIVSGTDMHALDARSTNADAVAAMDQAYPYKAYEDILNRHNLQPHENSGLLNARVRVLCHLTCQLPPVYRMHAALLFCVMPREFVQDLSEYVYVSDWYAIHRIAADTLHTKHPSTAHACACDELNAIYDMYVLSKAHI